jgi:hypothetical protein
VAQSLLLTTLETSLVALTMPGVCRSAGTGSGTGERKSGARLANGLGKPLLLKSFWREPRKAGSAGAARTRARMIAESLICRLSAWEGLSLKLSPRYQTPARVPMIASAAPR